jgi:hypothetical protein
MAGVSPSSVSRSLRGVGGTEVVRKKDADRGRWREALRRRGSHEVDAPPPARGWVLPRGVEEPVPLRGPPEAEAFQRRGPDFVLRDPPDVPERPPAVGALGNGAEITPMVFRAVPGRPAPVAEQGPAILVDYEARGPGPVTCTRGVRQDDGLAPLGVEARHGPGQEPVPHVSGQGFDLRAVGTAGCRHPERLPVGARAAGPQSTRREVPRGVLKLTTM